MFDSRELVEELKDTTRLGKRGEVLLICQIVLVVLLIAPIAPVKGLIDLVGSLALSSGIVFILYGLLSLGKNLSPLSTPRKKHTLVTEGMYAYVRHPMYGGLLMAALGLAALTRSETRLALSAVLWCVLEAKVEAEERALLDRYPTGYGHYMQDCPHKFFPSLY